MSVLFFTSDVPEATILRTIFKLPFDAVGLKVSDKILLIDIFSFYVPSWSETLFFEDVVSNFPLSFVDIQDVESFSSIEDLFTNGIEIQLGDIQVDKQLPTVNIVEYVLKNVECVGQKKRNYFSDNTLRKHEHSLGYQNFITKIIRTDLLWFLFQQSKLKNIEEELYNNLIEERKKTEKWKTAFDTMIKDHHLTADTVKDLTGIDLSYNIKILLKRNDQLVSQNLKSAEENIFGVVENIVATIKENRPCIVDINFLINQVNLLSQKKIPEFDYNFTTTIGLKSDVNLTDYTRLDNGTLIIPSKNYCLDDLSKDQLLDILNYCDTQDQSGQFGIFSKLISDIKLRLIKFS